MSESNAAYADVELRLMFENAPIGKACVALDGSWQAVNPALCHLLGYSADELRALRFQDVTHPADLDADLALLARLDRGEIQSYSLEKRYVRRDGRTVWAELHVSAVRHGDGSPRYYVVQVLDVSERRRLAEERDHAARQLADANDRLTAAVAELEVMKAATESAHARFAALVRHSSDVICVLDSELVLRYASPAYRHVFGHAPEETVGSPATMRVHPDDVASFRTVLGEVLARPGAVRTYEVRVHHASGWWRTIEVTASNQLDDPAVAGVVCNVRDVTERVRTTEQLAHLASHDSLTGLANRRLLMDRLGPAVARTNPVGREFALAFVDLDRFKDVNDSLGHAAGDHLLSVVAERLARVARDGDTVARLGGDEFVLLAERVASRTAAASLAVRILRALADPVSIRGVDITVACSIGIAISDTGDVEELMQLADQALYRAKARGGNAWEVAVEHPVGSPA